MDPVSQGLLGAAASQAIFAKRLPKSAWLIGMLAGLAADIDILIHSNSNPLVFLIYHRHFTHSLIFIPIGGTIVGLFCLALFRSLRPQWRIVILAAITGYATHALLDACTSYGTLLFWPFSDQRVAWDIISIIDPIFTGVLFIGVILSAIKESALIARITLLCCLLYLGFGIIQHQRALNEQQSLAAQRQQTIIRSRAMPTLGNLFAWRSLYVANQRIFVDEITTPLWGKNGQQPVFSVPLYTQNNLPTSIHNNTILFNDFKDFQWFCDDYITAVSHQPLVIADMRYIFKLHPVTSLWGIEFPQQADGQHVIGRRRILLE